MKWRGEYHVPFLCFFAESVRFFFMHWRMWERKKKGKKKKKRRNKKVIRGTILIVRSLSFPWLSLLRFHSSWYRQTGRKTHLPNEWEPLPIFDINIALMPIQQGRKVQGSLYVISLPFSSGLPLALWMIKQGRAQKEKEKRLDGNNWHVLRLPFNPGLCMFLASSSLVLSW